ncbi:uncharacterized protein LOC133737169 [Rosa rugosa]|uniref:uncharacterized protein LOC133737169 n=1 Tax=Rosa rugosa TaxID=74645 RepID=UPI002B412FA3|nr:uncharacterized protein LOC133737169 [Rosa rugosa]
MQEGINIDETVADYIQEHNWNSDKLLRILDSTVVNQIQGIPIPVSDQEDECIWGGPSDNGKFTVKSATWLQLPEANNHSSLELLKKLWKLNVPPKIQLFGWLLFRGRLKTRDRLSRFGYVEDNSCPMCDNDNETADHLFGCCEFTKEVWRLSNLDALPWNEARNDAIFRGVISCPRSIVAAAAAFQNTDIQEVRSSGGGPPQNSLHTIVWQPPPPKAMKINFDGSGQDSSTTEEFVIRNKEGIPLFAAAKGFGKTTVPVAEATALRNSLDWALRLNYLNVQVEGDSKVVIDAVLGRTHPSWRIAKIIQDIRHLASRFTTITFRHIYRKANFVADSIAHLGHSSIDGFSRRTLFLGMLLMPYCLML